MGTTVNSEEYNGSTWSEGGNINSTRSKMGAAGSQTAGVIYGGYVSTPVGNVDVTEEYDGTSWTTSPGTLYEDIAQMASFGTLTTAVMAGGYNYKASPPKARAVTQEYNGTTWASNPSPSGDLGAAIYDNSGAGTQTAGLSVGGNPGSVTTVDEYNGTTWSEGGSLKTGAAVATAAGIQTNAKYSAAPATECYGYDGTAWSTRPSLGSPRSECGGTNPAPATSTLVLGGSPSGITTSEEFTGPVETATASFITSS